MYVGLVVLYVFARVWWQKRKLSRSAEWPMVEGHIEEIEDEIIRGFRQLTLVYTYSVEGERYVGRESFSFVRDEEGGLFKTAYRGRPILVHYRPDKPQVSSLARSQI